MAPSEERETSAKVSLVAPTRETTMRPQAKNTRHTPPRPHAYVFPVVRELPSLPSPLMTPQLW